MDGTFCIDKFRMPLYTLAVVDSEGHGQPVAHARELVLGFRFDQFIVIVLASGETENGKILQWM